MGETTNLARMMDPRPLGEEWAAYVGVSPYGALRRAWRINALERRDVRSALGLTVHAGEDLYRLSLRSDAMQQRLRALYPDLDTRGWDFQGCWPLGGRIPEGLSTQSLRECTVCAQSAYHSLLFQMPGVTRCPWHGGELITQCPRCTRPLQAGMRLDLPPGRCECGHDLVHFATAVTGVDRDSRRIESYLDWASRARGRYWLIAPEQVDPLAGEALKLLMPEMWSAPNRPRSPTRRDGSLLLETVDFDGPLRQMVPRLGPNSGLDRFNPGTAMLPIAWASEFAAVSRNLAADLPPEARREAATPGTDLAWTLSTLPVTAAGRTLFLQTECFERTTLRAVARLAAGVRQPAGGRRVAADDRFGHWVRRHPRGTLLLEHVLKRVVLRGYADGARVALGRHIRELYDRPRGRPATRYPWVLFDLPPDPFEMPRARIVWTRQAGTA